MTDMTRYAKQCIKEAAQECGMLPGKNDVHHALQLAVKRIANSVKYGKTNERSHQAAEVVQRQIERVTDKMTNRSAYSYMLRELAEWATAEADKADADIPEELTDIYQQM